MLLSFFCHIPAGLLYHRWPASLLLPSCLRLDVHRRHTPVSYRCGAHLQQRVSAQELLYLRLSQPSCSCWILSVLRIQVLRYHQSVSKTDCEHLKDTLGYLAYLWECCFAVVPATCSLILSLTFQMLAEHWEQLYLELHRTGVSNHSCMYITAAIRTRGSAMEEKKLPKSEILLCKNWLWTFGPVIWYHLTYWIRVEKNT